MRPSGSQPRTVEVNAASFDNGKRLGQSAAGRLGWWPAGGSTGGARARVGLGVCWRERKLRWTESTGRVRQPGADLGESFGGGALS